VGFKGVTMVVSFDFETRYNIFLLASPSTMSSLEADMYHLKPEMAALLSIVSPVGCLSSS